MTLRCLGSVGLVGLFLCQGFLAPSLYVLPSTSAGAEVIEWPVPLIKLFALGHRLAVADGILLRLPMHADQVPERRNERPQLFYDIQLAIKLDPDYFEAYHVGIHLLAIVQKDPDGALTLTEQGIARYRRDSSMEKVWPEAWQLFLLRSYLKIYEFDDLAGGAESFAWADTVKGVPQYVHHLAARFREPGGIFEVGLKLVSFFILQAKESGRESLVRELTEKKQDLFKSQYFFEINQRFRQYLVATPASPAPHEIEEEVRERRFREFLRVQQVSGKDPWGETLKLGLDGYVTSATPRKKVFGIQH